MAKMAVPHFNNFVLFCYPVNPYEPTRVRVFLRNLDNLSETPTTAARANDAYTTCTGE